MRERERERERERGYRLLRFTAVSVVDHGQWSWFFVIVGEDEIVQLCTMVPVTRALLQGGCVYVDRRLLLLPTDRVRRGPVART